MDDKLQELTDRLYTEGVEKGEEKAVEIVREAEAKAASIIKKAGGEGERIVAEAKKSTAELKQRVEAEVRLAERQAMRTFKKEIEDVIIAEVLDEEIACAMNDPVTIEDFLKTAIENWHPEQSESPTLELLLPEKRRTELEEWFKSKAGCVLARGMEVKFHANIKGGFQIASREGGYRINLTDEDFSEFFKQYLRPRTRKLLFGEK